MGLLILFICKELVFTIFNFIFEEKLSIKVHIRLDELPGVAPGEPEQADRPFLGF